MVQRFFIDINKVTQKKYDTFLEEIIVIFSVTENQGSARQTTMGVKCWISSFSEQFRFRKYGKPTQRKE